MIRALWVVLCGLLLAVPACCAWHRHCDSHAEPSPDHKSEIPRSGKFYPEPPLVLPGGGSGAGLVWGTADFGSGSSVLIKIQVEDRNDAHTATFTVWSGTSDPGNMNATSPPPSGTQVYSSGGDVALRYWTTHLDRTYQAGAQHYWLFVEVNYLKTDGQREVKHFMNSWAPAPSPPAPLDAAHDFNGLD